MARKYLLITVYGDNHGIEMETFYDEDSLLDALGELEKEYKGQARWEVYKHLSSPKKYLEKARSDGRG